MRFRVDKLVCGVEGKMRVARYETVKPLDNHALRARKEMLGTHVYDDAELEARDNKETKESKGNRFNTLSIIIVLTCYYSSNNPT